MSPFPDWMFGCPGKALTASVDGWSGAAVPSLTGLHKYDRISRKKEDEGKTLCQVCEQRPLQRFESAAWERVLEAEAEIKREREQRKLMRTIRSGYAK